MKLIRKYRAMILYIIDIMIINISYIISAFLLVNNHIEKLQYVQLLYNTVVLSLFVYLITFNILDVYRNITRFENGIDYIKYIGLSIFSGAIVILIKANEFHALYPGIPMRNLFPLVAAERMWKDEEEIALTREAIKLTKEALEQVMRNLKPGMKEYHAQADFEYSIFRNGAECPAFHTIAGSGINGTMLHYDTNRDTCQDGSLLLLDLGARVGGYNSDITRTYPVNGRFTERQKEVYDLVLAANRKVAEAAKPGMTLKELNEICKSVLAKGLIELGLI